VAELDSTMALNRAESGVSPLIRPGFALRVEQGLGIGKLQVIGADPAAVFRRIVGFGAPATGRQIHERGANFAWMSPNEWLLTGAEDEVRAWLAQLGERGGEETLAIDLSHARASFVVDGANVRDVLASLCPLDLWSERFPVGSVARSLLGDTGMFIARLADLADGPRFRIVVDQTMETYAARLFAGPQPRSGAFA
jgi:sarcosine oxidase, subunit gamma